MKHSGKIEPIGITGLLAIAGMSAAIWFLLWCFTGIMMELWRYFHPI